MFHLEDGVRYQIVLSPCEQLSHGKARKEKSDFNF